MKLLFYVDNLTALNILPPTCGQNIPGMLGMEARHDISTQHTDL